MSYLIKFFCSPLVEYHEEQIIETETNGNIQEKDNQFHMALWAKVRTYKLLDKLDKKDTNQTVWKTLSVVVESH